MSLWCKGSALYFRPKLDRCQACPYFSECESEAISTAETIPVLMAQIKPQPRKPKVSAAAKKELERLARKGHTVESMSDSLRAGVNPIKDERTPKFLFAAFQLLIKGRMDRDTLALCYKDYYKQSDATVRQNVSKATGVLTLLGFSADSKGVYR